MNHTIDELLAIVYQHYPRGIQSDDARWLESEQYARMAAARRRAGADERWRPMLNRISERYSIVNHSLHLLGGGADGCYSLAHDVPEPRHYGIWFRASFLAPYHIAYRWQMVDDLEQTAALRTRPVDRVAVEVHGVRFHVPRSALPPALMVELDKRQRHVAPVQREEILFAMPPEEAACAAWICREIQATFGGEAMPPEVGNVVVPDVSTTGRPLGEATLFDCLFTDQHPWAREPPRERMVCADIEASQLPPSFIPVATVLGAVAVISAHARVTPGGVYIIIELDGVLHKDDLLQALRETHTVPDTPEKHHLLAAARKLEALIGAWSGEGPPTSEMVAFSLKFLTEAPD